MWAALALLPAAGGVEMGLVPQELFRRHKAPSQVGTPGKSCLGLIFVFFPAQAMKPLPLTCPDFQDPFSLAEKPPAEFCLSPDGSSDAISIDLLQKKGTTQARVWAAKAYSCMLPYL